jgi:hypothetical protein
MDRKTFLRNLAAAGAAVPCCSAAAPAQSGKCEDAKCTANAKAVRDFLSAFLRREERSLDRGALMKLMEERGRACCRTLDFRQKLIEESQGSLDKLVELMGKIVGPENCRREGDVVTLIYPAGRCVCTANPKREPAPDDPYCECSKANNQLLFETVAGKPLRTEVTDSPRRHAGARCRFLIHLA